jgi:hypothetical protein
VSAEQIPDAGLMGALLAVQAEAPQLQEDGVNPHFKNRYVPLDSLMKAITPVLTKHGLVWVTLPCRDGQGEPALAYRLIHAETGGEINGTMPLMLKASDPQGQGSAITYARRYSLMAVLGLVANKDDDGRRGGQDGPATGRVAQGVSAAPVQSTERLATAKQRGIVNAKAAAKGMPPTSLADIVNAAAKGEPIDWESQSAAERWLGRAMDRLPARLVDPIIARIAEAPGEAA